ncbi:MAG: DUF3102 domain-containing protein, partial [Lawsonibacter sp.]
MSIVTAIGCQTDAELDGPRTIEAITSEILRCKSQAGEAIMRIGLCLIEAKNQLSHGEWLPWLNERVEFSERTAQNFMRLARSYSNPQDLADLGYAKALTLLALPPEERERFLSEPHEVDGQEKDVIDMSARELEKAIRERDEAHRAMEQAKADAAHAEASRAKMEQDMAALKQLHQSAVEDAERQKEAEAQAVKAAEEAAAKLQAELDALKAAPVDVAVMAVDQEALDKAKAEAAAELQEKLDKAKEAKAKADEKRKTAEAALAEANRKLEEL